MLQENENNTGKYICAYQKQKSPSYEEIIW
jgi:hypothetical protein